MTHLASNNLVATHFLNNHPTFTSKVIQSVLDLINDPAFEKSQLTFQSPSDVYAHHASELMRNRASSSSQSESHQSRALQQTFPSVVLENVLDQIDASRTIFWYGSHTRIGNRPNGNAALEDVDPAAATLSNMALVHPSWTWPAQKALGRQLILLLDDNTKIHEALRSPLFGGWTKRAYIGHAGSRVIHGVVPLPGTNSLDFEDESSFLLCELIKRIPHLSHLSLDLDWSPSSKATFYPTVLAHIQALSQLRHLEFLDDAGVPSPVLGLLSQTMVGLPRLESLTWWTPVQERRALLSESIAPHARAMPLLDLTSKNRPGNLANIDLALYQSIPPAFLRWLFNSGSNDSKLTNIRLSFPTRMSILDNMPSNATSTAPLPDLIAAMNPVKTFTTLRELTLCIESATQVIINAMPILLCSCTSLRSLHISDRSRSGAMLNPILPHLPPTLTSLHYTVDLRSPTILDFEGSLFHWLQSLPSNPLPADDTSTSTTSTANANSSHPTMPYLRRITLTITQLIPGNPQANDVIHLIPALQNMQFPKLVGLKNACKDAGVRLKVSWRRAFFDDNGAGQGPAAGMGPGAAAGMPMPLGAGEQQEQAAQNNPGMQVNNAIPNAAAAPLNNANANAANMPPHFNFAIQTLLQTANVLQQMGAGAANAQNVQAGQALANAMGMMQGGMGGVAGGGLGVDGGNGNADAALDDVD